MNQQFNNVIKKTFNRLNNGEIEFGFGLSKFEVSPEPMFFKEEDGKFNCYNTIPPFRFTDQDSLVVTDQDVKGKIVVADFFFSSCPTICPVMKNQMQRVYRKFHKHADILLLSHTIDPQTDSVKMLKKLATELGVNDRKWLFLTGSKDSLHRIAKESYYLSAMDDKEAPGGKLHSGKFVLLDETQQIRGYYDGTDAEEVDLLMDDIKILLEEKNQKPGQGGIL